MTNIIGSPCIDTKDTACVDACPVDCIHPKQDEDGFEEAKMLYIDPEECIDCGVCEPECPVEAIYDSEEEAIRIDGTDEYVKRNYKFYGLEFNG